MFGVGWSRRARGSAISGLLAAAICCLSLPGNAVAATVSDQAATRLQSVAVQEKVAHDAYATFAAQTAVPIFDNLIDAENQHQATVRSLLAKHGITDPTAGDAAGAFDDAAIQASYSAVVAAGSASPRAALEQAVGIERMLISEWSAILTMDTPKDVRMVATNLLDAARNHLAALEKVLDVTPPAAAPPDSAVQRIQTAEVRAQVSGRHRVGEILVLAPRPLRTDVGVTVRWRVTRETRAHCTVRTLAGVSTVELRLPGRCTVVGYAPAPSPEYAPFRVTRTYRVTGT